MSPNEHRCPDCGNVMCNPGCLMLKLERTQGLLDATRKVIQLHLDDNRAAAGELLVNLDDAPPGSLAHRLLSANRIMRGQRDEAQLKLSYATRFDLLNRVIVRKKMVGLWLVEVEDPVGRITTHEFPTQIHAWKHARALSNGEDPDNV